jgi:surface carbohydrate biosynthesis protein
MKIIIYTLTHQRDKYIDGLLAEQLRQYGHEVLIRNYILGARESICYEKPDAIIHPMVGGEYKIDTIEKCKDWGIEVIVRRGEAGQGREQFNALDDNRKKIILGNWDYSPYVDLELVWGQEFADIISEQGWMPASKIKACGAFAFDPYFLPDCKRVKKSGKKTILFATGFSTADSLPDYCETGLPEGSDYHKELHKIHSDARKVWLDAIDKLVDGYSDVYDFELKVRPGESVKVYTDKVPSCVKVHPENSPSSEVLRNVDVLVHSGSTLAIEAHLLDIPSFNFFNVNPDPLLAKVSPSMDLYKELEFSLRRAVKNNHSNILKPVYRQLQDHLYGEIDGRACERAAGFVHEHLIGKIIRNTSPMTWPKDAKYLVDDGIHLEQQIGDTRWSCPCCRNIFWGENEGFHNCPYCNMKIERTNIQPGSKTPTRKTIITLNTESVLK